MSGSFEELRVPPVLCSFAFGTAHAEALRPSCWKPGARYLYLLGKIENKHSVHNPDYECIEACWQYLESPGFRGAEGAEQADQSQKVERKNKKPEISARLIGREGILGAVALFAFGSAPKRIRLCDGDIVGDDQSRFFAPYAAGCSAMLLASSEALPDSPFLHQLAMLEETKSNNAGIVLPNGQQIHLDARSACYRAWCRLEREGYYPRPKEASVSKPSEGRTEKNLDKDQESCPQNYSKNQNDRAGQGVSLPGHLRSTVRLVVPVFPGSNGEDDMLQSFVRAAAKLEGLELKFYSPRINLLTHKHLEESLAALSQLLSKAQILALPGGFSASDEPDGSAKFIAALLRQPQIALAIDEFLARDGLILGICNGFQALIKTGLLPYGQGWERGAAYGREGVSIGPNRSGHHIADLALCQVRPLLQFSAHHSPWLAGMGGREFLLPISHGEGRVIMPLDVRARLEERGQIAAVYCEDVNGCDIEALCSEDGRILGKMAHSERSGPLLYQNMFSDCTEQDIFTNGLRYFL